MSIFTGPRRKAAVVVTSIVATAALTAGAAYAWITLNATGSAAAAAAEVVPVTVTDIQITPMLPGTTRAISFKLTNPNNFAVKVTEMKRSSPAVVAGGGNCSDAQLTGPLASSNPTAIPGEPIVGTGTHSFTVPAALGLADTATAACTATFDLTVTSLQQGN